MDKNHAKISIFLLAITILFSCKSNQEDAIDKLKLNIEVMRFDKDFAQLKPQNLYTQLPQLQKKYGSFYIDYVEKVLNVGSVADTNYYQTIREIILARPFNDLQSATDSIFPNFQTQEKEITRAFKHIKYYYPEVKTPKVISYISGFQIQTTLGNGYVGIGLDMFLGANAKFYPALVQVLPQYITRRFTPENITPRIVEAMAREDMFPELDKDRSLLAKMVYNGKILYFMDKILPNTADSLKIGYTNQQANWVKENEADIWAFFLDENLLYETDYFKIQKYISEAPFTPGIGEKNSSAPKLASFIGWQMIKKYMDENPNITLKQLMAEKDEQKVLRMSKYRPSYK